MQTNKYTMVTEVHYSQDKEHRYLLTKEWDQSLGKATIIMLNPTRVDGVTMDRQHCTF